MPYTTTGSPTGTQKVQLSDNMGIFTSALDLATSGSTTPLTATIPTGLAGGTGYKVRVVIGSTVGLANAAFTINGVAVTPAAAQTGYTGMNGTQLTATETPTATVTGRQWYYGTAAAGGPYPTAIAGATGATYTPNFATAGTYYVVEASTFSTGSCTAISNAVTITVTASSAPTLTTTAANPVSANGATLNGNISSLGAPPTTSSYGFVYSLTSANASPQLSGTGVTAVQTGTTAATGAYLSAIMGLAAGTSYSFQAYATNAAGTNYGGVLTFTTSNTITTDSYSPTAPCAGSDVTVNYTAAGTFTGTYSAEISDASGSFTATGYPIALTTTASTPGSSITATLPATLPGGTGYKIRVRNTAPATIGTATPTLTVNKVTIAPVTDQTIVTNAAGTTLTASETTAGTSRQWYYSTTQGTGYTNLISGATGTTYAPQFAAVGTYYVVVTTTFSAGCSVTSNEVKVVVTAPAVATGTISPTSYCVGQGTPASVTVPFTVPSGSFAAGNVFTAYLSKDGFATKFNLGTLTGTGSGSIAGSIAQTAGLTTASTYRIRVEASSPAASATTDNGTDLTVASYLDNEVASATAAPGNAQATLTFTAPATCATNVVVTIRVGSSIGSKPAAGGTYTPGAGGSTVAFGTGTDLSGTGQYVVYNGPASGSITVTGLANNTRYAFGIFTTNGGSTGTSGYSNGTLRTVLPVQPGTLTEVLVPRYLSGRPTTGSTHTTRLPYVWRVALGGLLPSTTYKYYTAVRASSDAPAYGGVGIPIDLNQTGSFVRQSGTGLNTNSATFTTDASGSYIGWFGLEPSADTRFNDQSTVYPLVVLNGGDGNNVESQFLATTSPVTALLLGTATTGATGVRGNSFGTAKNLVLTYDNTAGTGRPLAATWLESDGSANTTNYAGFYGTSVDGVASAYGLLTPNTNASGIQRVEQRALADGSLLSCAATDADGNWPGGANTVNPTGGTTALVFTTGDTPFAAPTAATVAPTAIQPGTTITVTGTNFSASPNVQVVFSPGSTVAAATVNAAGTSLTVVVPAGAGLSNGTVAVSNGCGTSATLATTAVPASAPGLLLVEDDFDYATSTVLTTKGWVEIASGTNDITLVSTNVTSTTYPKGAALSALPATTSSAARLIASGQDLYKAGAARPVSTTLYASALINVTGSDTGGEYFFAFYDVANSGYRAKVYIKKSAGSATTFTFGLQASSELAVYDPTLFTPGVYTLVLKLENSSATSGFDVASLYVLPVNTDIRNEPASPLVITAPALTTTGNSINAVALRQGGSASPLLTLDGVRLATGWGAAVGSPNFTAAAATLAAGNYYNVTVNNGDVVTTSGAARIENNLTLASGNLNTTATSLLLYPTAGVAGGSDASFVNGPVNRLTAALATGTTATAVFPVGSGTAYRPLTLNTATQTSVTTYRATQTEGNPGQNGVNPFANDGTTLTRVSKVRSFTLTPYNAAGTTVTQPTSYQGTVTLSYGADDVVTDPATVTVAKRDNSSTAWVNAGGSGTGTSSSGTVTSGTLASFSDFALASTNPVTSVNPLPVSLTRFTAARSGGSVALNWATASETNSARFEVERSLDGVSFAKVATVVAAGNSLTPLSYTSLDRNAPAQALYYRLRLVDVDGTAAYSAVVAVAGEATELTLSPNPARSSVRLTTAKALPYVLRSPLGQVVLSGTTQAGTATTVEVQSLAAGVYLFELQAPTGRVVSKLVKE